MKALWIRVDAHAIDSVPTARLADRLNIDVIVAFGHYVALGGAVAEHTDAGVIAGVPDIALERWARWAGERGAFAAAVREIFQNEKGEYADWRDAMGKLVERREQDRMRKTGGGNSTEIPRNPGGSSEENGRDSSATVRNGTVRNGTAETEKPLSRDKRKTKEYSPEFETTFALYPRRAGTIDKPGAYRAWCARRAEGVPIEEMHAGTERYRRACDAASKTGSEMVMQAKRFYGPNQLWAESHDVVASSIRAPDPRSKAIALAKRMLFIGEKHNLLRAPYQADIQAYWERVAAAGAEEQWPTFSADLKAVKLYEFGAMDSTKVVYSLADRLEAIRATANTSEPQSAVYRHWISTIGAVDPKRLSAALAPVLMADPARYSDAQLITALDAFQEGMQSDRPEFRGKWTPEKFASELHHYAKLGTMELVDEWGQPTERGRATGIFVA